MLGRWYRAGATERRTLLPGLAGGAVIVVALIATTLAAVAGPAGAAQAVFLAWPLALLLGRLRARLDRSAVSRLIVELGAGLPVPDRLRAVIARTLHDPTVELAYWLPESESYVDSRGEPAAVETTAGRALTYLERDGSPVAVLVHDAALSADPELLRAVAAGAGMALENERLQAEIRHQLREVSASRSRIVEAADAARGRVERELHDGAQQRLVTVALALRLTQTQAATAEPAGLTALLDEAGDELARAIDELRELARGIYPVLLTDAGLGPALTSLAERSAVAAVVDDVPGERLPETFEQACYFVVSEALDNAAKHACATSVHIGVTADDGLIRVEVADDGKGGARASGSGLRGLADRVGALGGRLQVHSPSGGGTRVVATIPRA